MVGVILSARVISPIVFTILTILLLAYGRKLIRDSNVVARGAFEPKDLVTRTRIRNDAIVVVFGMTSLTIIDIITLIGMIVSFSTKITS
jgi:hypothetical protein